MRTRRARKLVATLLAFGALALGACTASTTEPAPPQNHTPTGQATPAPSPTPTPEPTPTQTPPQTPAALPLMGEPCTAAAQCAAGLACLEYYGIAGPRGPKFTSCEIRCGADGGCPSGHACTTVADGPGAVCRPATAQTTPTKPTKPTPTTPTPTKPTPTTPTPTKPTPGNPTTPVPDQPAPDSQGIGQACGSGDACAPGLSCLKYYGFAGPSGPEFKSCEKRCTTGPRKGGKPTRPLPPGKGGCPAGTTCMTISDGPGTVCRPPN